MSLSRRILHAYDDTQFASLHHELFYEYSGFSNFGYWLPHTRSGKDAAIELLRQLLAPLGNISPTHILDVACGEGGSTRFLGEQYPNASITAINLSPKQLSAAKRKHQCPNALYLEMDAARLSFPDSSFDLIVCAEAAFHFNTRKAFLSRAFLSLKPGGHLVLSDMLTRLESFDRFLRKAGFPLLIPEGNALSLDDYPGLLTSSGFVNIHIKDARAHTFEPYKKHFFNACIRNLSNRALWPRIFFDPIQIHTLAPWLLYHSLWLQAYPLVCAQRPANPT